MNGINTWYRGQKALSALKTLEQFKNKHNISVSEAFQDIKGMSFPEFKARFQNNNGNVADVDCFGRSHDKVTKKEFRDIQRALNRLDKYANAGDSSARKVGLENAARKINDNEVLSYFKDKSFLPKNDYEERYDEEDSEELTILAKKEEKQGDNEEIKVDSNVTNVVHNEAMEITDESTPEVENSTTGTGNIEIAVSGSTVNAGNIVPNAQVKAFKEEIDNALNPWWRKGYKNPEKAPTIEQAFKSVQDKWNITPENFKNLDPNLQETICLKIYSPSGAREEVVLQSVVGDLDPDKFNHLYDGDNIRTSLKAAVTGALFCSLAYYEGSWKKVEEETKKLMSQIGIHTAADLDKLPQNCQDKCVEVLFKAGDGHRAGCIFKALGVEKLESKEDFDKLPRALQLVLRAKKTTSAKSDWFRDVAEAVGSPKDGEALIGILPEENVRIEDGIGQNFSVVIPE